MSLTKAPPVCLRGVYDGWEVCEAENGVKYYYDRNAGHSQFEVPTVMHERKAREKFRPVKLNRMDFAPWTSDGYKAKAAAQRQRASQFGRSGAATAREPSGHDHSAPSPKKKDGPFDRKERQRRQVSRRAKEDLERRQGLLQSIDSYRELDQEALSNHELALLRGEKASGPSSLLDDLTWVKFWPNVEIPKAGSDEKSKSEEKAETEDRTFLPKIKPHAEPSGTAGSSASLRQATKVMKLKDWRHMYDQPSIDEDVSNMFSCLTDATQGSCHLYSHTSRGVSGGSTRLSKNSNYPGHWF